MTIWLMPIANPTGARRLSPSDCTFTRRPVRDGLALDVCGGRVGVDDGVHRLYALVAAIFAELPAISVRFIAFSTEVIDLSGKVTDPLALLLQVQVGGGTHIGLGLRAARAGITRPSRSLVVLVSDFEEGVSVGEMTSEVRALVDAGVKCIGLAALDDSGTARFHQGYASLMASVGMPVAAVSPEHLGAGLAIRLGLTLTACD